MDFRSKNLLITGGAGFIGSNFIKYFLDKYQNSKIINLDLLTYAGNLNNTNSFSNHPNYKFINGDICDSSLVTEIFNEFKIDGVINFAAETHVDNSITDPDPFVKTNIFGVYNLINIAFNFWMEMPFKCKEGYKNSRFHQISTDEVYGSIDSGTFSEKSCYKPNSPYAASKASADLMVRSFNKTFGLNTTISMCSNNYGPNQNQEKLIPKILKNFKENIPIPIYGNGINIRDWIHVTDHCEAIDIIYNYSEQGHIYNIGAKNELSNLELISRINSILNNLYSKSVKIEFVKDRYGHDYRYSINASKLEKFFKWKPKKDFDSEIKKIIKTYCDD